MNFFKELYLSIKETNVSAYGNSIDIISSCTAIWLMKLWISLLAKWLLHEWLSSSSLWIKQAEKDKYSIKGSMCTYSYRVSAI